MGNGQLDNAMEETMLEKLGRVITRFRQYLLGALLLILGVSLTSYPLLEDPKTKNKILSVFAFSRLWFLGEMYGKFKTLRKTIEDRLKTIETEVVGHWPQEFQAIPLKKMEFTDAIIQIVKEEPVRQLD